MKLLLVAGTALTVVSAAKAQTQIPLGLEVSELSHAGDGCPTDEPGSVVGELAPNGTYGIVFAKLDAGATNPNVPGTSRCAFGVKVRLPVNYKMQVETVIVQGKHDAPGQSVAKAFTSYAMNEWKISYDLDPKRKQCQEYLQRTPDSPIEQRRPDVAQAHGIGESAGNFAITWRNKERGHFTACGGDVNFQGDLGLLADAAGTNDLPEISVQRLDAQLKYGVGWGWRFVKCREVLNGAWRTTIVDRDGRPKPASMYFNFDRGSISGAGQAIILTAVNQEHNRVTGVWKRGNQQGWVRFETAAVPPLDRLEGQWGVGLTPGEGVIGAISATRVNVPQD